MNSLTYMLLVWLSFTLALALIPPLTLGVLRKTKARLQNRIGAPIYQPLLDLQKLLQKGETVSEVASWIFRNTAAINLVAIITIAVLMPWLTCKPQVLGADLFLVIYLFGLARFFTVLAALDAGSAFSGFGASREVTLSLLVEPAIMLSLASLGSVAGSSDLSVIFSFANPQLCHQNVLWMLAGVSLFLASLVELSRMPVDDPTTHLELTMVHEAMILENSGRNLALVEYTHYLKMAIMFGISGQCFMHAIPFFWQANAFVCAIGSLLALCLTTLAVALIEGTGVKLRWTKLPEFIAYPVAMSLLCVFLAIVRG